MSPRAVPGKLVTEQDSAALARGAASRIESALRDAIAARGRASMALSGGNTPRDTYAVLARAPGLDWTKIRVFWVDERAVPPTDDRSNYRWAKATLLDGAHVPPAQVRRMPADAADLDGAAKAYETLLKSELDRDAGGVPVFDVVVLGVGDDGHTASLFPGKPGETLVDATDRFVVAVPAGPGREARMTITRPVIQHARLVLVLVEGSSKRPALARAWAAEGDVHETPIRIVRDGLGELVWIVDPAAAGSP